MRSLTLLCLVILTAASCHASDQYTDKYDKINIDEILGNRRLLVPYIKCILGLGKCAPEGKELREHIIDALETECSKCTEVQQAGTRKIIKKLINDEPEYWKKLVAKYDPHNKYTTKYENELKEVKAE